MNLNQLLITRYVNQLPMNDEFPKSSNDRTRFFHYHPAKLIKVGSIEFDRYCKEIHDGLEALPILSNGFQSVSQTQIWQMHIGPHYSLIRGKPNER